jgi:hypothetical protein
MALVLSIRDLLYEEGYTIAGARKRLQAKGRVKEVPSVSARQKGFVTRLQKEVDELLRLTEE